MLTIPSFFPLTRTRQIKTDVYKRQELKDGSDYEGPFPILTGQTIDLDTIQAVSYTHLQLLAGQ